MQEHLIFSSDNNADWHIDEHTRSAGRAGVAAARLTLAACTNRDHQLMAA